jgi:hypothetical protein
MLHRRNSASSGDAVEAEAAARAHRAMIEKAQAKERHAQEKTSDESAPNIEWGKSGVAGLLDEDLDVNAVSGTETLKNKKGGAVPVGSVSRAPPKTSLGWEPQVRSEVEIAAPTPYPVTEAMEQSIQFLTESLKSERKRADDINDRRLQLEAENAALRQELRLAQDKVFKAMFPDSM